jgi:hypothetical protein
MGDGDGGRLTRRHVLAGVAGAAGVGLIGGAGTRAFLRDTEVVPGEALGNPYEGARVDVTLRCGDDSDSSDACTAEEDGEGVSFAFEDIEPGDSGSTVVCPSLGEASEPAWLWLGATPQVDTLLAETLTVTLTLDGTAVTAADGTVADGISLKTFLDAFAGGAGIPGADGPDEEMNPFAPDEERCLELSWSLPDDPDPEISEQSVGFTLRFAAVQYRADVDASTTNPWQ